MFARGVIFPLSGYAFEVVCVVLETVPGLVGIGEAGVKAHGLKDVFT